MDLIATCKNSQKVASNNNYVKNDISNTKTILLAVNINVKTTIKYVPNALPSNSNTHYYVLAI